MGCACSGDYENPYDLALETKTEVVMTKPEICPTCHQPVLRDATCAPAASQKLDCDVCGKEASFIKNGRALCYEHAFGAEKS